MTLYKTNKTLLHAESSQCSSPPHGRRIDVTADQIESRDLFIGTREIVIAHGEERYRLRLTAQNKLILTK